MYFLNIIHLNSEHAWSTIRGNVLCEKWPKHRFPFVFEDGVFEERWKKGFGNLFLRMLQLPLSRDVSSEQKCARCFAVGWIFFKRI